MCMFGYLADVLGLRHATMFALSLTVFGSLGSGVFSWGDDVDVYGVILACRFLLGIGAGGLYPLSAAAAARSTTVNQDKGQQIGLGFFWQVPGTIFPYLVGLVVLGAGSDPRAQFRIILAMGAIPAGLALLFSWLYDHTPPKITDSMLDSGQELPNPFKYARAHPKYIRILLLGIRYRIKPKY